MGAFVVCLIKNIFGLIHIRVSGGVRDKNFHVAGFRKQEQFLWPN